MKTPEQIKEMAINSILLEKACDSIGIYGASVAGPNGYKERSDYQNGWNDAITKEVHRWVLFEKFFSSLPPDEKKALGDLLLEEDGIIQFNEQNEKVNLWLVVNDAFYYAADGEDIAIQDLMLLCSLYKDFGWDGIVAWVAVKRDMEPLQRSRTEKYCKAKEFLKGQ